MSTVPIFQGYAPGLRSIRHLNNIRRLLREVLLAENGCHSKMYYKVFRHILSEKNDNFEQCRSEILGIIFFLHIQIITVRGLFKIVIQVGVPQVSWHIKTFSPPPHITML